MIYFMAYLKGFEVKPKPARSDWSTKYRENQQQLIDDFETYAHMLSREDRVYPVPLDAEMEITYCVPHRRKMDRANIEKAVEDALVKAGVLEDDSVKHLPTAIVVTRQGIEGECWLFVKLRSRHPLTGALVEANREVGEKILAKLEGGGLPK